MAFGFFYFALLLLLLFLLRLSTVLLLLLLLLMLMVLLLKIPQLLKLLYNICRVLGFEPEILRPQTGVLSMSYTHTLQPVSAALFSSPSM